MVKETIKSASGKTLGYKVQVGSRLVVQDASGATLGHFDKNVKKTVDKAGRVLYSGDQTSALVGESTD